MLSFREEMDVKHIYLYGSYAKGNYSSDSDIDIAVVGDDFSTSNPLAREIMKTGIKVE